MNLSILKFNIGRSKELLVRFLKHLSGLAGFTAKFLISVWIPPYEFGQIKKHLNDLGLKSLPLVGVIGFIMGLILSMQSRPILMRFGAESYIPMMVSVSVIRELGPVIGALIIAGRVSSGIGAELGSMRVTEQIDALEVSAVNPFKYLVVTRVIACIIILPVLTIYMDSLSILGGYLAEFIEGSSSWQLYMDSVIRSVTFSDIIPGIAKTTIFGMIIGIVGSYYGYNTTRGTEGVGKAATISVVISSFLIILVDMILVKLTLLIW
jgi:phospholipid/cholesterol/gamma-HCH transport system permease protein